MNQQSVSYPTPRPLLVLVHGYGLRCTRHVFFQRCHDMASPSLHGVPRVGPPLQRYYGTLRLPAVPLDPFEVFTSRYHRVARGLLPSVVGVPPGARELSVPVSPSGLTMETSGSLRFLGNPGGHCPCSSTPAGSGRLSGPRVSCLTRPPPVSTTKAPSVLYFRGSITQPLTSLSTLRRMGRPTTTQDSLLAAGPALPGGIVPAGFQRKVSEFESLPPFQSLPDARTPYLTLNQA